MENLVEIKILKTCLELLNDLSHDLFEREENGPLVLIDQKTK